MRKDPATRRILNVCTYIFSCNALLFDFMWSLNDTSFSNYGLSMNVVIKKIRNIKKHKSIPIDVCDFTMLISLFTKSSVSIKGHPLIYSLHRYGLKQDTLKYCLLCHILHHKVTGQVSILLSYPGHSKLI